MMELSFKGSFRKDYTILKLTPSSFHLINPAERMNLINTSLIALQKARIRLCGKLSMDSKNLTLPLEIRFSMIVKTGLLRTSIVIQLTQEYQPGESLLVWTTGVINLNQLKARQTLT